MRSPNRMVVGTLSARRASRARTAPAVVFHALERRLFFTGGTLVPIATLNGANGENPVAVVQDASGNLFGVNENTVVGGDTVTSGNLFEVPAGTSTVNVLTTFSDPGGPVLPLSLIADSAGNLYGTYEAAPDDSAPSTAPTTVYEVAVGTTTVRPLATVSGTLHNATVDAVDPAGDVFGINGHGNPFEVVKDSGTASVLAGTDDSPLYLGDLKIAPDGALYATTSIGGANNAGSLYKIVPGTASVPTSVETLAAFDPATTGSAPKGLVIDDSGNLLGFCVDDGPEGNGTVFELPSGSHTISLVASFTDATGDQIGSKPVLGDSGTLYGLTRNGGANGFGTVVAVPPGGSTVQNLADIAGNQEGTGGVVPVLDGKALDMLSGALSKKYPKIFGPNTSPTPKPANSASGSIYDIQPANGTPTPTTPTPTTPTPTPQDIIDQLKKDKARLQKERDDARKERDELRKTGKKDDPSIESNKDNTGMIGKKIGMVEPLPIQLHDINTHIGELENEILMLMQKVDRLSPKIERRAATESLHPQAASSSARKIAQLNKKIAAANAKLATFNAKLAQVEAKATDLFASIDTLEDSVDATEATIDADFP